MPTGERVVYACRGCGVVWVFRAEFCPACDSVEVTETEPPSPPIVRPAPAVRPTLRLVGFSPITNEENQNA